MSEATKIKSFSTEKETFNKTKRQKILWSISLEELVYTRFNCRKDNRAFKKSKRPTQRSPIEREPRGTQEAFHTSNHQENVNQNTRRCHCRHVWVAAIKTTTNVCWQGYKESEPWDKLMGQYGTQWRSFSND